MLNMPPHIFKKVMETKHLQTAPHVKRTITHVAVIDKEYEKDEILGIPYNIVITGIDAITMMIDILQQMPDRIEQFIGVYCTTLKEKIMVHSFFPKINIGMSSNFKSINNYIKSLSECQNAALWRIGDDIPKLHLLTQIWKHPNPKRFEELQVALLKNAQNPYVHKIHVLLDGDDAIDTLAKIPSHLMDKIVHVPISGRINYKVSMEYLSQLPETDFGALINTDIYFDHTIRWLWNISMKNTCMSLLRHETTLDFALNGVGNTPVLFGPRSDSQDTWIFAVKDLKDHLAAGESWNELDFNLGVPGCDNAIAGELLRRRWVVINPSLTVRALHLHKQGGRTYNVHNLVTLGLYLLIDPSVIQ